MYFPGIQDKNYAKSKQHRLPSRKITYSPAVVITNSFNQTLLKFFHILFEKFHLGLVTTETEPFLPFLKT